MITAARLASTPSLSYAARLCFSPDWELCLQSKYLLINFDPVAVSVGPLDIHWYGVMYLLAFLSFWLIGNRRAVGQSWRGWNKQDVSDVLFYGMLGVILGGRIGYRLFYGFDMLLQNPLSLLKVWDGGMSFHGGLLGVMFAMGYFGRRTGRTFWQVADFVAPMVPLGLAFGRLGNFIGGELWGRLSDLPWAKIFAKSTGFRPGDDEALNQDLPRLVKGERVQHPTFRSGAVLEVSGFGRDLRVTVQFDSVGRKKLLARYANLEKDYF